MDRYGSQLYTMSHDVGVYQQDGGLPNGDFCVISIRVQSPVFSLQCKGEKRKETPQKQETTPETLGLPGDH